MGLESLNLLKSGPKERLIAGIDASGSKDTPNETWLATGSLEGHTLTITKLSKIGMHALGKELATAAPFACGLDFPFSLPVEFLAAMAMRMDRPAYQSWQEIAEQLVFMPFEDFANMAAALKREPKRHTDKSSCAAAASPLHRVNPSMVQMTYHGMRALASLDPSKFSIQPFQDLDEKKSQVFEVYPRAILKCMGIPDTGYKSKDKKEVAKMQSVRHKMLQSMLAFVKDRKNLPRDFPHLDFPKKFEHLVVDIDHALDALLACYGTAMLVACPELFPDPFACDNLDVLLEGWIYEPSLLLQPAKT